MSLRIAAHAVELFASQAEFLTTRRSAGDVVLLVETPKERRFALVSPEEASRHVEQLGTPGEVLAALRQNPESLNGGLPGYVWVVAVVGDECKYFTLHVGKGPASVDAVLAQARAALTAHVEVAGLPEAAVRDGLVVVTIHDGRASFAVVPYADGLALAEGWGLSTTELEASTEGRAGVWVIAWVEGVTLYFRFDDDPSVHDKASRPKLH